MNGMGKSIGIVEGSGNGANQVGKGPQKGGCREIEAVAWGKSERAITTAQPVSNSRPLDMKAKSSSQEENKM